MDWTERRYYAEKTGKFYCFESISQRNDAVKNHGMEAVPSHEIYKYRVKYAMITKDKYDKIIKTL